MKNTIAALLFLAQFCGSSTAQVPWQVGTTWHLNSGQNPLTNGILFTELKLDKDTILGGLSGFEISGQCNCINANQPRFVRQADRKIWYWDDAQWELLYDFTLQAGDSLFVRFKGVNTVDSVLVVIDSVGTIYANNGQALQVQYINRNWGDDHTYDADFGWHWIEGIGSNQCLFPQWPTCDPQAAMACFEDFNGLQFSLSGLSCDVITLTQNPSEQLTEIKIQPNPFTDQFDVLMHNVKIKSIEVFNQIGQKCITNTAKNDQFTPINGQYLPNGIYLLRVVSENDELFVRKIIKL